MIELITKIDSKLIHTLANQCNDSYFKDFNRARYEEALYRADRTVARKYQILERMLEFNTPIVVPPESESDDEYITKQKNTDIELDLPSFHQEIKVILRASTSGNEEILTKSKEHELEAGTYTYYLTYGVDKWLFNYLPRTTEDTIIIFYMCGATVEKFDADVNQPVIPNKYEDERIKYALQNIAKEGIAKFKEDRQKKYISVLRLNSDTRIDSNLVETQDFPEIKPYRYP
jgi:hypothetical protein